MIEWGGAKLAAAIERDLHVPAKEAQELLLQLSFDPEQPARRPSRLRWRARRPSAEPSRPRPTPTSRTPSDEVRVAAEPALAVARGARAAADRARATTRGQLRQLAAAREAAVRELHVLARELVSSLQFYQGQPGALPFVEVLVSGGTSRLTGFVGELERLTRVRVRAADPLARVEVASGIGDRDDLASLAIAIGLGVED